MSAHVSAARAARMYGLSDKTVRRWIAGGKLPAEKIDGAYSVAVNDLARLVGDVSTQVSAPTSAQSADTLSAHGPPTDVRPDDGDVHPPERPSTLAQADAMAALIQTTIGTVLGPLVGQVDALRQTVERQADELKEMARENGELRAENRALLAFTAAPSPDPTTEGPWWFHWPRGWIAATTVLVALAAVVAVALLTVLLS